MKMVWMVGFKPTASPVQAEYSNQTELHPEKTVVTALSLIERHHLNKIVKGPANCRPFLKLCLLILIRTNIDPHCVIKHTIKT